MARASRIQPRSLTVAAACAAAATGPAPVGADDAFYTDCRSDAVVGNTLMGMIFGGFLANGVSGGRTDATVAGMVWGANAAANLFPRFFEDGIDGALGDGVGLHLFLREDSFKLADQICGAHDLFAQPTQKLDGSFVGHEFDEKLLATLPCGVDPCGENGEFHSFVYAGPMLCAKIPVSVGESVVRDQFVFADLNFATMAVTPSSQLL